MKKIIIAIAAGVLSFYSFASEITLNCQLAKTVFTQGENVTFDMTAVYPEVYKPYLWQAYMNAKKVPADFCEKTGTYNNNHKNYPEIFIVKGNGKQPQKGYFRYPAVKASGENTIIKLKAELYLLFVITTALVLMTISPEHYFYDLMNLPDHFKDSSNLFA